VLSISCSALLQYQSLQGVTGPDIQLTIRFNLLALIFSVAYWLFQMISEDQNWKMFYRLLGWTLGIALFWVHIVGWALTFSYDLRKAPPLSDIVSIVLFFVLLCVSLLPFILLWNYVMISYERALEEEIDFWKMDYYWRPRLVTIGAFTLCMVVVISLALIGIPE